MSYSTYLKNWTLKSIVWRARACLRRAAKDARPMRRDALARHRIFSTSGIAPAEVTAKGVLRLDALLSARAGPHRAGSKAWLENGA